MITEQEIMLAQQAWGDGVVAIGAAFNKGEDYRQVASDFINAMYAYPEVAVLFKPTKATEIPFRTNFAGALSYFVAGNADYPEDKGFALQPWQQVEFVTRHNYINDATAFSMGHYVFTDYEGNKVKVEFSFGYVRAADNTLQIVLHHSSLPFVL